MASAPQFAASPHSWEAFITGAGGTTAPTGGTISVTSRSGTGGTVPTNAVLLLTAGSGGSRIEEVTFTALGTSTANVGRIFIKSGTETYLVKEISIPAITPGAGTPVASVTASFTNFVIASGDLVYVSVATADANYSVIAFGGDF